jgi:glutaminyl-peptide cyclotransferase
MYQRLIFIFFILPDIPISDNYQKKIKGFYIEPFFCAIRKLLSCTLLPSILTMQIKIVLSSFIAFLFILISCEKKLAEKESAADSNSLKYSVLSTLPHNDKAFTEGLVIYDERLLESTGQNKQSWIAEVDQATGQHEKKVILDSEYFGEGITVLNKKIYHLTYKEKTGFIYDATTYEKIGEFNYNTEGWGITNNGKNLIMSDGTDKLYFLDTTTLKVIRTLPVIDVAGTRVKNLNELEYINHYIFANVYESSWIVKIDPTSGKVVGQLDLTPITSEIKRMYPNAYELNGIAYHKPTDALLITGKFWPKSYLIKIH